MLLQKLAFVFSSEDYLDSSIFRALPVFSEREQLERITVQVSRTSSSQFDLACDSWVNKATEKCIYSGKCVLYIIHIYGSSEKAKSSCFYDASRAIVLW